MQELPDTIREEIEVELKWKKENLIAFSKSFKLQNPFIFDKANIWWQWNEEKLKWIETDEIEIVNEFRKYFKNDILLFNTQTLGRLPKILKQIGRENLPQEPPKTWIQFADVIFDIDSRHIVGPATPEYFFTNPIPWKLEQGEIEEYPVNNTTPTIRRLFTEWVGEEYVETMFEIIAYCCLRDYPIHLIFCFNGGGRNGKSQYLKIIEKFLGTQNTTSAELDALINNRFESYKLYKKLVVTMSETNFNNINRTSMLKKLCGGDRVSFERKGYDAIEGQNYAKIILSTNSLPPSDDTTEGFYRRWFIIDFPNNFEEIGRDIVDSIPDEEFNNLCVKVVRKLPILLHNGKFTKEGTIIERERKFVSTSNPIQDFITLCCVVDEKFYCKFSTFSKAYTQYLASKKMRKVTYNKLSDILYKEGFERERTWKDVGEEKVNGSFILGLTLQKDWEIRLSRNQEQILQL